MDYRLNKLLWTNDYGPWTINKLANKRIIKLNTNGTIKFWRH